MALCTIADCYNLLGRSVALAVCLDIVYTLDTIHALYAYPARLYLPPVVAWQWLTLILWLLFAYSVKVYPIKVLDITPQWLYDKDIKRRVVFLVYTTREFKHKCTFVISRQSNYSAFFLSLSTILM